MVVGTTVCTTVPSVRRLVVAVTRLGLDSELIISHCRTLASITYTATVFRCDTHWPRVSWWYLKPFHNYGKTFKKSRKICTSLADLISHRRRNRGGNWGARPRNAKTAGAKASFRPRNNFPSLSAGWQSKFYSLKILNLNLIRPMYSQLDIFLNELCEACKCIKLYTYIRGSIHTVLHSRTAGQLTWRTQNAPKFLAAGA